jgi:hypothetical protein
MKPICFMVEVYPPPDVRFRTNEEEALNFIRAGIGLHIEDLWVIAADGRAPVINVNHWNHRPGFPKEAA